MSSNTFFNDAVKNAIKENGYLEENGIKRFHVDAVMKLDVAHCTSDTYLLFEAVVSHKEYDEDKCNITVFEIDLDLKSGHMFARFNGSGRVEDNRLVSAYGISWGSFTNEIAKDWLNTVYDGE